MGCRDRAGPRPRDWAPDVLAMTKTTMIEGMAEIAKDYPVEVEGGIGKTWGSTK